MIQDNLLLTGGAGNAQPLTMFEQTQLAQSNYHSGYNGSAGLTADGIAQPTWAQKQYGSTSATGSSGQSDPWQQMLAAIRSLISQIQDGGSTQTASGNTAAPTAISDGNFSSTGDPHLALTGSGYDANGNPVTFNSHYDSMVGHTDLLNSGDTPGGFQVSTAVTAPNAQGVTQNGSATFQGNNGNDTVTMKSDGTSSIVSDGQAVNLANGGSVVLDGGETVTRNNDGSLTVAASTADGSGTLTTTFKANGGGGVDVSGHAHNVAVGGDLVNGANGQAHHRVHHHHDHDDVGNVQQQAPAQPQAQPPTTNSPVATNTPTATSGNGAIIPWSAVWQNGNQYSANIDGSIAAATVVGSQSSGVGTFTYPGANLSGAYEVQDPSSGTGDIFLRGNGHGEFGWGTTQSVADQIAAQTA